jgi:hypothetical protein
MGICLGVNSQDAEQLLLSFAACLHEGNVGVEGAIQIQLDTCP